MSWVNVVRSSSLRSKLQQCYASKAPLRSRGLCPRAPQECVLLNRVFISVILNNGSIRKSTSFVLFEPKLGNHCP